MTTRLPHAIALLLATAAAQPVHAADDDALDLQATPAPAAATAPIAATAAAPADGSTTPAASRLRLAVELAGLHASRTGGLGDQSGHRAAVDLRWTGRINTSWRFGLSNRIDQIDPAQPGLDHLRNSLREAYVGWQPADGNTSIELGRVNLRHGPAYGYNPTDFFRTGATRLIVSADPVALRENRLGTVMLRGSQLWAGGGAAVTWAPKLSSSGPSSDGLSLDLGSTNAKHRVLFSTNSRLSERWSGEALLLLEQGASARLGANVTGLLSDAVVMYGEFATGRSPSLLAAQLGQSQNKQRYQQASLGWTWALPSGLSVTAEASYNGAGLNKSDWQQLFNQGAAAAGGLLAASQASQELAPRRAWLLYATQKNVLVKQLDLTAFVRQNLVDHSTLAWVELRYHWPRFDAALQLQHNRGAQTTEFGALPYRQVIQLVGTAYF